MLLEGSPHPEIEALWIDAADRADTQRQLARYGRGHRRSVGFRFQHHRISSYAWRKWRQSHSEDEICSHLHFYRGQEALVQWFDAFSVPLSSRRR
jgi:hypothetical protein